MASYQLKPNEPISAGLKRIVKKELESALDRLNSENQGDPGVAIHEARKCIKKIRSVLQLVRVESDRTSSLNRKLRAAGRKLSELRDAAVTVEVFDKLNHKYPDGLSRRTSDKVRRRLAASKSQVFKEAKTGKVFGDVSTLVHACMKSDKNWLQLDGFPDIAPGIEGTFRCARKAMKNARQHPEPENFHEWRKRVKNHWYLARLLSGLCGPTVQAEEKDLKNLESWLGEDHNLAVLRERVSGQPGLDRLIDRYQTELRGSALALGEQIYEEQPRRFTRRIWQLMAARSKAQPKPSRGKGKSAR